MNAKIIRINAILTAVMLVLFTGCSILNILLPLLIASSRLSLPSGLLLSLAVLLPTVVLLIHGVRQAKRKQGVFDLIISIVTLIISLIWAVFAAANWGTVLAYRALMMQSTVTGDMLAILSYLNIAYTVFSTLVALYLLAAFMISVLRAKQKRLQIKAELHKPAAAVLILVPNLINLLQTLLNPWLSRMSIDLYVKASRIFMYTSFGITTLSALALTAFVLLFGLIIKKSPDAAQDVQPAEQTAHQESSDLPFNLPAGVNPDDV